MLSELFNTNVLLEARVGIGLISPPLQFKYA